MYCESTLGKLQGPWNWDFSKRWCSKVSDYQQSSNHPQPSLIILDLLTPINHLRLSSNMVWVFHPLIFAIILNKKNHSWTLIKSHLFTQWSCHMGKEHHEHPEPDCFVCSLNRFHQKFAQWPQELSPIPPAGALRHSRLELGRFDRAQSLDAAAGAGAGREGATAAGEQHDRGWSWDGGLLEVSIGIQFPIKWGAKEPQRVSQPSDSEAGRCVRLRVVEWSCLRMRIFGLQDWSRDVEGRVFGLFCGPCSHFLHLSHGLKWHKHMGPWVFSIFWPHNIRTHKYVQYIYIHINVYVYINILYMMYIIYPLVI